MFATNYGVYYSSICVAQSYGLANFLAEIQINVKYGPSLNICRFY